MKYVQSQYYGHQLYDIIVVLLSFSFFEQVMFAGFNDAKLAVFDKFVWINVQTCVGGFGYRRTQLCAFISWSCHSDLFWKICLGVLTEAEFAKFAKFTGKHLCQSPFSNKVAGLRVPQLKCMENHWKIAIKEISFGKVSCLQLY